MRTRHFSIIEMFIAMLLLSFLVLILCRSFANVQNVYTTAINTAELYESGRVVFDVITRDLQSAVARADDMPGQDIRFHQPGTDSLWFVTAVEPSGDACSSMTEVGYRLANHEFQRAFVDDTSAAWNIYGARDDADDQAGYLRVIEGVIDQNFVCYDAQMNTYVPDTAGEETALPSMVTITLTIMDSKSYDLWLRLPSERRTELENKVARTFRKNILLGGRFTGI